MRSLSVGDPIYKHGLWWDSEGQLEDAEEAAIAEAVHGSADDRWCTFCEEPESDCECGSSRT